MERADVHLRSARQAVWPVCLLYLDLDDFKQVNDRFGHERGDEVLKSVATAILASVRGNDLPARVGGDEFVVLLQNVDRVNAERIARRIHEEVEEAGADIGVGCTIGAAYFAIPPQSASELVAVADRIMYAAKEAGKRRVLVREVG
jgi:diguanylate cyclase (GGDEF)-like protein